MALIEDYALVGGMTTAALISREGSVDWLCMPRFDSPAVFTSLLGGPEHGRWTLSPAAGPDTGATAARRRYRGDTLILESEWDTPHGTVRVTDFMPPHSSAPQLTRIVDGVSGQVTMQSVANVRFGYGKDAPRIRAVGDRTRAAHGPDTLWFDAEPPVTAEDGTLRSQFTVGPGQRVAFTLTWQPADVIPPLPEPRNSLASTETYWNDWTSRSTCTGPDRETVVRSLITLKALTHTTGGIVAAPTTSLPEEIGGSRNWDYRYCWLRDSALTVTSLVRAGHLDEARAWRAWLVDTLGRNADGVQIMYGLGGERLLPERELGWLPGYENSGPVRIGNAAAEQLQLDVFGEIADALDTARRYGLEPCPQASALQVRLVETLEKRWREPDEGIWEVRGPRRHFVHSKVMAWVALDRTIRLIESGAATGPLDRWRDVRDEIHDQVCEQGYDPERGTFTQSYGSDELDASLLLIPLMGFLPPDDPRVIGTVDAVVRELSTPDGFLLRYPTHGAHTGVDGLKGDEGAFLACSFWLVEALTLTGRHKEARTLLDRLLALRNDLGLLAEEWDPRLQRQVGNAPQGFSHWALADAVSRTAASAGHIGPVVPGPRIAHRPASQPAVPAVVA
ncbi:glycoside hydrolase family 15 protein [Streptomyces albipurpureus]|uniref:glycoside hydrolase family 15 protein n=1 Tax=Streptomyces albipurpureus TaxID=2897419 RepID=UPI003CE576A6